MDQFVLQQDYDAVARLRRAALDLLEQQAGRSGLDSDRDVITALQDVANRLGVVEQAMLRKLADARNVHAGTDGGAPWSGDDGSQPTAFGREASLALVLAEALVPLAPTRADEAERWLRILRAHGQVGIALEALGMPSGELATPAAERGTPDRPELVRTVADDAARFAGDRHAPAVGTLDVLFAVILHYDALFDRALYGATGKRRAELLARLATEDARVS